MTTSPELPPRTVITYPTVEAALDELGKRVFGAGIVIAAAMAADTCNYDNPVPEVTHPPGQAEKPQYRLLEVGEVIQTGDECCADGKWVPTTQGSWGASVTEHGHRKECFRNYGFYRRLANALHLEKETECLHALWHGAAAEVNDLRHEVARLAAKLNDASKWEASAAKCQSDLFAYAKFTTDIATALGMGTMEISFDEVLRKVKDLVAMQAGEIHRLCQKINNLDTENREIEAERCKWMGSWKDATEALQKVTKERNELHARVAGLEKPSYRMLKAGEQIQLGDEYRPHGYRPYDALEWLPVCDHAVGSNLFGPNVGFYRLPIKL